MHAYLFCKDAVRNFDFTESIKENRQVVVEVEFFKVYLPVNTILDTAVFNRDRQVPTLIVSTKLCVGWIWPFHIRRTNLRFAFLGRELQHFIFIRRWL